MRQILVFFSLFLCQFVYSQRRPLFDNIELIPVAGVRIHNSIGYLGGVSYFDKQMVTSPSLGLELRHDSFPLSVSWQADFNLVCNAGYIDSLGINPYTIAKSRLEHQVQLYYKLKRFSIGLGYYRRRDENLLTHTDGTLNVITTGIQTALSIPLKWLDLEWRYKDNLTPVGGITGWSQHSLLFLYRFNRPEYKKEAGRPFKLNAFAGPRFFSTKEIDAAPGEHFGRIGISSMLGLELYFPKWKSSFNLEKDWYYAFNGGSPLRDIKAEIKTSFISLGYHLPLKNGHRMKIKGGLAFVEDSDISKDFTVYTPHLEKIFIYQVKGIGSALSYNLFKKCDLEIRYIFPYVGERSFSSKRLSIGLLYSCQPIQQ